MPVGHVARHRHFFRVFSLDLQHVLGPFRNDYFTDKLLNFAEVWFTFLNAS
jgi:hypothetical protein